MVLGDVSVPSATEAIVIAALGLLCGLLSQPFSSRIVGWLELGAARIRGQPGDYVNEVRSRLGPSKRAAILSKMHGEVTFFTQMAVLSAAYGVIYRLCRPVPENFWGYIFATFVILIALAFEVAERRVKRAERENRLLA